MGSTLKQILRQPPNDADIRAIIAEMSTDGARGAAILGGAILEELVRQLLLTKMVELSSSERDSLFGPTQPLSSFSAKIDLGYAIGAMVNSPNMTSIKFVKYAMLSLTPGV